MQQLKKDYERVKKELEDVFNETQDSIALYGTSLEDALKNQLILQMEWELISKKARRIHSECELKVDETFAAAFKKEMTNSYKSVSTTEGREFAKTNPDYLEARMLMIKSAELKEEAHGLLEVVTSRKYVLNNLTNAIISACNKEVL